MMLDSPAIPVVLFAVETVSPIGETWSFDLGVSQRGVYALPVGHGHSLVRRANILKDFFSTCPSYLAQS